MGIYGVTAWPRHSEHEAPPTTLESRHIWAKGRSQHMPPPTVPRSLSSPPCLPIYGQRGRASTSLHPHCHKPPLFFLHIWAKRRSHHSHCDEAPPPLVSPYRGKGAEPAHPSTRSATKSILPSSPHIWAKGRSHHITHTAMKPLLPCRSMYGQRGGVITSPTL